MQPGDARVLTALKRFMAKEWRRISAARRGGGAAHLAFDTAFAEGRYAADPGAEFAPDQVFDRQWSFTLLELTMARLQAEFAAVGKADEFAVLSAFLTLARERIDYGTAAARLAISEGAARVAVHRLRRRFRELYREELAQTLPDGADVAGWRRRCRMARTSKRNCATWPRRLPVAKTAQLCNTRPRTGK